MNKANSNKAVTSEGTPVYDDPAQYDGVERGVKRAAKNNGAGNVKRVKEEILDDGGLNPVAVLNHKIPGIQYKFIGTEGVGISTTYSMQITVGGQVFEASCISKRKTKMVLAQAALKYISENNISKDVLDTRIPMNNPTTILYNLRVKAKYEPLEDLQEGNLHYHMKVIVDNEEFEAKGRSKQLAKSFAAMYALQKLFNLKFTAPDNETIPIFDGDEQEWRKYQPIKESLLFEGHNIIREMHNMYRPLDCEIIEADAPNQEDAKYKCTVKIENMVFNGTGRSRTAAKLIACRDAMKYLKQQGMLEHKLAEAAAARKQRRAKLKEERGAAKKTQQLGRFKEEREAAAAQPEQIKSEQTSLFPKITCPTHVDEHTK